MDMMRVRKYLLCRLFLLLVISAGILASTDERVLARMTRDEKSLKTRQMSMNMWPKHEVQSKPDGKIPFGEKLAKGVLLTDNTSEQAKISSLQAKKMENILNWYLPCFDDQEDNQLDMDCISEKESRLITRLATLAFDLKLQYIL